MFTKKSKPLTPDQVASLREKMDALASFPDQMRWFKELHEIALNIAKTHGFRKGFLYSSYHADDRPGSSGIRIEFHPSANDDLLTITREEKGNLLSLVLKRRKGAQTRRELDYFGAYGLLQRVLQG